MGNKKNRYKGPSFLPILRLPGISYFIDLQLGQFRDVENPGDYHDFDSEEGRRMRQQANVVTCSRCNANMIVSGRLKADGLNCVRCMTPIELEE